MPAVWTVHPQLLERRQNKWVEVVGRAIWWWELFSLDASDFPVKQEARSSAERDKVEEVVLGV